LHGCTDSNDIWFHVETVSLGNLIGMAADDHRMPLGWCAGSLSASVAAVRDEKLTASAGTAAAGVIPASSQSPGCRERKRVSRDFRWAA
jgi:hypothetical protein